MKPRCFCWPLLLASLFAARAAAAQTRPPELTGALKKVHDQLTVTAGFRFTHVRETRKAGKWTAVTYAGEAVNQGGARFTMRGAGRDDGTWLLLTPTYGKFFTYRRVGKAWRKQASAAAMHLKEVVLLRGLPGAGTVQKLGAETVDGRPTRHYRVTAAPEINDLWVDKDQGQLVRLGSAPPTAEYRYLTTYHQLGLMPALPTLR